MSAAQLSEDDVIARFFAPLAGPGGLGLLDDAALLRPVPGRDLVVTADALVAGVHFFADDPPGSIALKCLGVNLSDLAAKGARPLGFILALALPAGWTPDWLGAFAAGLGRMAAAFDCPLLGGDTVRTPGPLMVSITVFGDVAEDGMVPRTGVKPGDRIYVSGTIGDAALGLRLRLEPTTTHGLDDVHRAFLLDRYLHPRPRLGLRGALLAHAGAGMDVSDGLVGDLTKMLRASGCSAEVELARVPLSAAALAMIGDDAGLFDVAVTGGDDYEVLAAVPPEAGPKFEAAALEAGLSVACIGLASAGAGPPTFRDRSGAPRRFARGSFSHF